MISKQKLERFFSGSLHLPSFLLPLMVLSISFSSKAVFFYPLLNRVFSALFMISAIIVFYRVCRNKILGLGIITAVVALRILRLSYGDLSEVLEFIYLIPYILILLGIGTKMIRDYPHLLLRQSYWICAISIVLSLMQIMGVEWTQSLANYYPATGGSNEPYLFVQWSDLHFNTMQLRPVGFAYANNVLSQFLLFFYAYGILWFTNNKHSVRPSLKGMFFISFACALSGAKVVFAGIVIVSIVSVIIARRQNMFYMFRVLLTTSFAYFLYWLFFPGSFVYNFNIDLFAFNAMLRLKNLTYFADIPFADIIYQFISEFQTGEYIGPRSVASTLGGYSTSLTGIGTVLGSPFFLISASLLLPFWIFRLRRLASGIHVDMKKVPLIMLVAAVASSAGGPFLFTSYFWFFFSFAMYPLTILLLKKSAHRRFK
jgi:hypothetical protein